MNLRVIWILLKETFAQWQEDKVPMLAAALAYYTAFSLAPLLIIVIAIAGFVFGQDTAQTQLFDQLQNLIGSQGAEAVSNLIENAYQPTSNTIAAIVGIITLLFGATTVFAQLKEALNIIWNVAPKPGQPLAGFVKARVLSFAMVLGIGFLLLVSLVVSAILAAISQWLEYILPTPAFIWHLIDLFISFSVVTLLFAQIYRVLPDAKVAWSDVWVGAAITSLLFTIGKSIIGFYLGNSGVGSAYGAAGSFAIILIWIFYSAQILLIGAEFTQVWANHYGSRIRPRRYAISTAVRNSTDASTDESTVVVNQSRPKHSRRKKILKKLRRNIQAEQQKNNHN